ncbi:MAG: bifunctional hydroxymethylpyrimidine kinase/phosphomethylpyrimidine kinase [Synechococcus sp.]
MTTQPNPITPPIALTIAGSDSGGGAGIQADLLTFMAFEVHGCTAISCVTAQNTCGVSRVDPLPAAGLTAQIEAVRSDLAVRAIKTGMLLNTELIQATAEALNHWPVPIVIDPVMVSRTGAVLLEPQAIDAIRQELVPLATLLTPNRHEASLLSCQPISDETSVIDAAATLHAQGAAAVLIKRGDQPQGGRDLLFNGEPHWLEGEWINTPHSHGTGCSLSAAITAGLAKQRPLDQAIHAGRAYVKQGLKRSLAIGHDQGPICHWT